MIFRVHVLLPDPIWVVGMETVAPITLRVAGTTVRVYPPVPSAVQAKEFGVGATEPLRSLLDRLVPRTDVVPDPHMRVDGEAGVPGDLVRADFHRRRFDRHASRALDTGDPSDLTIVEAVNRCLTTLRSLGRAAPIRPIDPTLAIWMGHYLRDDGTKLRRRPPFVRMRRHGAERHSAAFLTPALWEQAGLTAATFAAPAWDTLLLDAADMLASVAPALALAYAGLEAYLDVAMSRLPAAQRLPTGLWDWLNERNRSPGPDEQLDALFVVLAGKSLKTSEPTLWQEFRDLKRGRDTLMHTGSPIDTAHHPVTLERAEALVRAANRIVDWVEATLPEESRTTRYAVVHQIETTRDMM